MNLDFFHLGGGNHLLAAAFVALTGNLFCRIGIIIPCLINPDLFEPGKEIQIASRRLHEAADGFTFMSYMIAMLLCFLGIQIAWHDSQVSVVITGLGAFMITFLIYTQAPDPIDERTKMHIRFLRRCLIQAMSCLVLVVLIFTSYHYGYYLAPTLVLCLLFLIIVDPLIFRPAEVSFWEKKGVNVNGGHKLDTKTAK